MTKKEFVSQYLKRHSESENKIFPDDFTSLSSTKFIVLPNKSLTLGAELFGQVEILTTEGNTVYQAENLYEAKYIIYFRKYFSSKIKIPSNPDDVKNAVVKYEAYLDSIIADIENQLEYHSMNPVNLHSVSNEIFKKLNLVRY